MRLRVKEGWFWDIGNNINLVLINFKYHCEIFMCRKKKLYENRKAEDIMLAKNERFWIIYICYECMNGR